MPALRKMKNFSRLKSMQIFLVLIFIGLITISLRISHLDSEEIRQVVNEPEPINVVLNACGNNLTLFNCSTNFLKTAFLFTQKTTKFTIFANEANKDFISKTIETWPLHIRQKHIIEFREVAYPDAYKDDWYNLYGPCATLRLFFPDIIPDMDSAIYLDTDIIVMTDLQNLWNEFDRFTPKQMLGVVQEREVNYEAWYPNATRVKFPFIPPYGVNSGVLLMNFTRMRDFSFFNKINLIYKEYKEKLRLYDQDLINIIGYYNPEIIYKLNCSYNFIPYHCVPHLNCHEPKLIHGILGVLVGGRRSSFTEPFFEKLFHTITKYNFTNSMKSLISELEHSVKELPQTKCTKYSDVLLKPLVDLNLD